MSRNKILRFIFGMLIVIFIGGVVFYYRVPILDTVDPYLTRLLYNLNYQLEQYSPCQKPLTFRLGAIDPKFKLSNSQVISAVNQASAIWSKAISRQLFAYATTSGEIKIDFVYDYRQETTDKLKKLGIVVETSQKSYEDLKVQYDSLKSEYQSAKAQLDQMISIFTQQEQAYNTQVNQWNQRGGAPKNIYDQLNQTKASLDAQLAAINDKTSQVNPLIDNLNTEGDALNQLIDQLNLNVQKYNTTGAAAGKEFQEGVYIQDETGRRIEVYEFNSQIQLVRLLTHELGHALGLEHSTGTQDIMYYLNEAGNEKPTANDLTALKAKCNIK